MCWSALVIIFLNHNGIKLELDFFFFCLTGKMFFPTAVSTGAASRGYVNSFQRAQFIRETNFCGNRFKFLCAMNREFYLSLELIVNDIYYFKPGLITLLCACYASFKLPCKSGSSCKWSYIMALHMI